MRERKDQLIKKSEKEAELNQLSSKFTLPEGSRKIVERYRGDSSSSSEIGQRLYTQGVKDRQKKLKLSAAAKEEMDAGAQPTHYVTYYSLCSNPHSPCRIRSREEPCYGTRTALEYLVMLQLRYLSYQHFRREVIIRRL